MRRDWQVVALLDLLDDAERFLLCRSTRAVGASDEVWLELDKVVDVSIHRLFAGIGLWRKQLEGKP